MTMLPGLPFAAPARALVRGVPDTFARCLRHQPIGDIDLDRARAQHAAYVRALQDAGVTVHSLPPLEDLPDSCFVEDPALLLGRRALLHRSAAPSRAPEAHALRQALADWCAPVISMPAHGTLDGGDVLRIHHRLYVGRSARTSPEGIAWLRLAAAAEGLDVIDVPLRDGLHLKSAATLATPHLLLYLPDLIDPTAFTGVEALPVPEAHGANVLALGDTLLASASAPQTIRLLQARGLRVVPLQVDEFHKGDGALTCLSLRQPPPGAWCA